VGQRTLEDGYFRAGAIIGPIVVCCDEPANIGGGVSQFATTLYNAVFFSGLEDVRHTPHTLWFTRYPMGREATLGFPSPDVVFRNNTDAAVLIDTETGFDPETGQDYVTVRFFGNNGGLEVEAGLSDQRNWVDPFDYYQGNADLDPEAEPEQVSTGKPGFTVTVFRYITHPDGEQTTETWVWAYDPFPNVFEVHPCKLPEDDPDYMPTCPSGVPNVIGKTQQGAVDAITAGGWETEVRTAANGSHNCTDAGQSDKVTDQHPTGGFLAPEETVTVWVCQWTEPTTTTTTTTTAP
jgi:hypothetical protein